jgi:hypothetical protein
VQFLVDRRTVVVGDEHAVLLAMIHECIRTGRYAFTAHALTKHTAEQRFTPRQGIEAILNGAIIEDYPDRGRCLIAGTATGLKVSNDYISTYIHCTCGYDDIRKIVVISMYRPGSDQWINHARRRPQKAVVGEERTP